MKVKIWSSRKRHTGTFILIVHSHRCRCFRTVPKRIIQKKKEHLLHLVTWWTCSFHPSFHLHPSHHIHSLYLNCTCLIPCTYVPYIALILVVKNASLAIMSHLFHMPGTWFCWIAVLSLYTFTPVISLQRPKFLNQARKSLLFAKLRFAYKSSVICINSSQNCLAHHILNIYSFYDLALCQL